MKTSKKGSSDPYKGFDIGSRVMYLPNEREYTVETRYLAPYTDEPILVLNAVNWAEKGMLRGIAHLDEVIKLT